LAFCNVYDTLTIRVRDSALPQRSGAKLAKAAGVPRESLYRALSSNGNPRFSTLHAVLKAAGLKMAVEVV
jgi:probable addiction module antidote protein